MTFNELNLSAPVLRAVAQAGYESPSPIQAAAIPPVLAGRDLMYRPSLACCHHMPSKQPLQELL